MLKRICRFYDDLVPIMRDRAANQPLATAEVFSASKMKETTIEPPPTQTTQNHSNSCVESNFSKDSMLLEENWDLNMSMPSSRSSSPDCHEQSQSQIPDNFQTQNLSTPSTINISQRMPPARVQKTPTPSQRSQTSSTSKKNEITQKVRSSSASLSNLKQLEEERKKERMMNDE